MQTEYATIASIFGTNAKQVKDIHEHIQMKEAGWPPALIKSTTDSFYYALLSKNMGMINFKYSEFVNKNTVRILKISHPLNETMDLSRGMEFRVDDIIWVVDAPEGVNG